jgi:phosphotransferase system  glucose/maltose/N-acetylglucosamine-specific IIC component
VAFWQGWADHLTESSVEQALVRRSALTLRALAYGPTGAIVAAVVVTLVAVWLGTRRAFAAEFMFGARLVLLILIVAIAVALFYLPLRRLRLTRAVPGDWRARRRSPGGCRPRSSTP